MKRKLFLTFGVSLLFLAGLSTMGFGSQWILSGNNDLPSDLEAKVNIAGGTLVKTMDDIGIAVAEFDSREAAELMGVHGLDVMLDLSVKWIPDQPVVEHIGSDETYYGYQWHLPAIEADKAWDEGVTGAGVRVAVLDTGVWWYHPDLINNIDFAASATFVPGTTTFMDDHWHGTHVAGIIAAADNGMGTIGVAPNATLIIVKVMDETGTGNYSWMVEGIEHAVNQGANIINLSLGNYIKKSGNLPYYTANDAARILRMIRKSINWANSRGVLVVTSAGNESYDLGHSGDIISVPTEVGNLIAVSATAPIGLQAFDTPASYTNYGISAIWVAAPGGDFSLEPAYGYWYDGVLSTTPGSWSWATGTSQAAPMASGVAALILEKYGPMSVGRLKNHLAQTADDLGKPGQDEYYGRGRVNAYKAVTK